MAPTTQLRDYISRPPRTLKQLIDLPALLAELGVPVEGGSARCLNPEHEDANPSMGIFPGRDGWKMKCLGCGWTGDVFDALRLLGRADTFNDAWREACRIAEDPPSPPAKARDLAAEKARMRERVERSWAGDPTPMLSVLMAEKGIPGDPAEIAERWRIGYLDGRAPALVFPYLTARAETIFGAKLRRPKQVLRRGEVVRDGWTKRALPGSSMDLALYGEWRDRGRPWVVLCEGETDALAVDAWFGDRVDVLAVPGAGIDLSALWLRGRKVVTLFDADDAGREAAERWRREHGTLTARLPEGEDACSAGRREVRRALRKAVRGRARVAR